MFTRFFFTTLIVLTGSATSTAFAKEITLRNGQVITQSVKIKKDTYALNSTDTLHPAIVIEGDNLTIDFNGATLYGTTNPELPDQFTGTAIQVRKGKNITIKNAIVNGYLIGLLANRINGLKIVNCNFSYNWREHLKSGRFKEDLDDWMSFHNNERDEWLRFGAGIYLRYCDNAEVYDNTITNGQCGLMMTNSHNGRIYNNNFSFNSAIGIGMYQSNNNIVMNNKADWNVRGFSYGYYYRGQDSGGIVVFDNCNKNVFAHNSATHSGDGFFLWAGQSTIETGVGGCNDNLIYGNDFSFAPTNAVEITFSRNKVIKNKLKESWHGIWGGYSYNTIIVNNEFGGNLAAVSIEHGQNNIIQRNRFLADSMGLEIWSIPNRKADFGLMKVKDTKSRSYSIAGNSFINVPLVYAIKNTDTVQFAHNVEKGYRKLIRTDSLVKNLVTDAQVAYYDYTPDSIFVQSLLPGIKRRDVMLPASHPRGRKEMMMTEWGPYNFEYPLLWWVKTDKDGRMHFEVRGPRGNWKLANIEGGQPVTSTTGTTQQELIVQKDKVAGKMVKIELVYTGSKTVSPFGKVMPAGKPYVFSFDESNPYKMQIASK